MTIEMLRLGYWRGAYGVAVIKAPSDLSTFHHTRCSGIASVNHYDSNRTSDTAVGAACGLWSTQVVCTYVW